MFVNKFRLFLIAGQPLYSVKIKIVKASGPETYFPWVNNWLSMRAVVIGDGHGENIGAGGSSQFKCLNQSQMTELVNCQS